MKHSSLSTSTLSLQHVVKKISLAVYCASAVLFVISLGFSLVLAMDAENAFLRTTSPSSSAQPVADAKVQPVDPQFSADQTKRVFDRITTALALPAFDQNLQTSWEALIAELGNVQRETLGLSIAADQRESHLKLILTYEQWEEKAKEIGAKGATSEDRIALQNEVKAFEDQFFYGRTP